MRTARLALAAFLACLAAARVSDAQTLTADELTSFLVQCIGTGRDGRPTLPTPVQPSCTASGGLQGIGAAAPWRKHDRGGDDPAAPAIGFQANDSVLVRGGERPVVAQIADFGDAVRRFGRFDPAGDGGDLLLVLDGAVYGVFSEDGSGGRQWLVAEACRGGSRLDRLKSWLMFGADVARGAWTSTLARLAITRSSKTCPVRFSNAWTRYRREVLAVPFRALAPGAAPSDFVRPVDTIVSDHFGGRDIERANHLERFFFGRGLGKYRWERWEQVARSDFPDAAERGRVFARSGRCPPLAFSDPPAPDGWVLIDCRHWTTLVRQAQPWSADRLGWPPRRVLDEIE